MIKKKIILSYFGKVKDFTFCLALNSGEQKKIAPPFFVPLNPLFAGVSRPQFFRFFNFSLN